MTDSPRSVDPVELLGSLAPAPGWNERTDTKTDLRAAQILDRVMSGNVVPFKRPRRRLHIVTGVVIAASLGGAAVAAVWNRAPEEARTLSCWSEASSEPAAQVGRGWDGISDPIEACTPTWESGDLGTDGPPRPLQACVADNGIAAVIPGDGNTCTDLGLANFEPLHAVHDSDVETANTSLAAMVALANERVNAVYNETTCVSPEVAAAGTAEILEELGLLGWATEIASTFSADEPCATVALDTTRMTACIVPIARAE